MLKKQNKRVTCTLAASVGEQERGHGRPYMGEQVASRGKGVHMQKQGPVVLLAGVRPRGTSIGLGLLGRKLACASWAKFGLNC